MREKAFGIVASKLKAPRVGAQPPIFFAGAMQGIAKYMITKCIREASLEDSTNHRRSLEMQHLSKVLGGTEMRLIHGLKRSASFGGMIYPSATNWLAYDNEFEKLYSPLTHAIVYLC